MQRSISDAAEFVGVSARVLRHYDEIGLLKPSGRTTAGYRQYSDDDLLLLARIVEYRKSGIGLEEIRQLLNANSGDVIEQLTQHEAILRTEADRIERQLELVRQKWKALKMGINLTNDEMREVFGDHDPTKYEAEVQERWGESDAYKESARRTSTYSKDDWARIGAEGEAVELAFLNAMQAGLPPESDEAKAAAEMHRLQIDRNFYPCSYEMQTGLADMYIADPRFTEHYDKRAAGLAAYVRNAIIANALDHM